MLFYISYSLYSEAVGFLNAFGKAGEFRERREEKKERSEKRKLKAASLGNRPQKATGRFLSKPT
jgi:hypothetical protein